MLIPQLQYIHKVVVVPVVPVVLVQVLEKTVEIPHLQIIKEVDEIPEIQAVQGTQTPESFGFCTCPPGGTGGTVEVVEIGALLPAESAPPLFDTAPVSPDLESLGTAPVRQVAHAEILEMAEIGALLLARWSRSVVEFPVVQSCWFHK